MDIEDFIKEYGFPVDMLTPVDQKEVEIEVVPVEQLRKYFEVSGKQPIEEFKALLEKLADTASWTAGERGAYYAFFLHGWHGRLNEAEYQNKPK